jgi:adenosylcobinamide-phosphate synthase
MTFLALALTLLFEQLRPIGVGNPVVAGVEALADSVQVNLNAGRRRHGLYAWLLLVVGLGLLVLLVDLALGALSWFASLAFQIVVLYVTLGFRQFSHPFTLISKALAAGDLLAARHHLTEWKRASDETYNAADLEAGELARQAIEHGLLLAHRDVFGVLFWYVLLPGPVGPVMYRLAEYAARRWNRRPFGAEAILAPDHFGEFAATAYAWIDWLPARLTALGFAIVGDFEGAIYCWRRLTRQAATERPSRGLLPAPDAAALILAAASGALGQRIMPAADAARYLDEAGLEGAGLAEPEVQSLRSVVGLVWRAVVLWMVLLLLLTLVAHLRF